MFQLGKKYLLRSPDNKHVGFVSIPRPTWLAVSVCGKVSLDWKFGLEKLGQERAMLETAKGAGAKTGDPFQ